jgi:hypothetical protein
MKKPILLRSGCRGAAGSTEHVIYQFTQLEGLKTRQIEAISTRYVNLIEPTRIRARIYAYMFHIGRTIVTVGSLIVPALLSIQYTSTGPSGADSRSVSYVIYWVTWCISLLVTTCNGVLTLFKVDKKYFLLHTSLEQYKSEAWQYIYLTGKYGKIKDKVQPTHANQYPLFTHHLELIKLKLIEEEYFKLTESHTTVKDKDGKETKEGANGTGLLIGQESSIASTGAEKPVKEIAGVSLPTPDPIPNYNVLVESTNAGAAATPTATGTAQNTARRGNAGRGYLTPSMPMR